MSETKTSAIDLNMFEDEIVEAHELTEMEQMQENIRVRYNNLISARTALHIAINKAIAAKEAYDDGEKTCLLSGMVEGKNAELRAANLADLLSKHTAALRAAKAAERDAELNYRLAVDEVERVKLLVALLGIK